MSFYLSGGFDWSAFTPQVNDMIIRGIWETLYMTLVSTLMGYVLGLPLGIVLAVTGEKALHQIKQSTAYLILL